MKKLDEQSVQNSCWNKAKDDEYIFVLLERDKAFADTIRYWCQKRIELGLNKLTDPQIAEAMRLANEIGQ